MLGAEKPMAPPVAAALPAVPVLVVLPVVPPLVLFVPVGTRVLAPAASCLYAASVLFEEVLLNVSELLHPGYGFLDVTHFSLTTMTMPCSQCLPWAQ